MSIITVVIQISNTWWEVIKVKEFQNSFISELFTKLNYLRIPVNQMGARHTFITSDDGYAVEYRPAGLY